MNERCPAVLQYYSQDNGLSRTVYFSKLVGHSILPAGLIERIKKRVLPPSSTEIIRLVYLSRVLLRADNKTVRPCDAEVAELNVPRHPARNFEFQPA